MSQPQDQTCASRRGVVAVILMDQRFLVIRRSQTVVAPGMYCFPGGAIEPGESDREAVVRKAREELGVIVRPIRQIWSNITPWNVRLSWWLTHLHSQAELVPNPAEVASVHWVTVDEILALADLLPSNRDFLAALAAGAVVVE